MSESCGFTSFLQEGKSCSLPVQKGAKFCFWHDPEVRKDQDYIRDELQKVIEYTGGDLEGFQLRNADLGGMDLSGVDMKDADLRESTLDNANLSRADMRGAKMSQISAIGTNFESANLMAASLTFGNFTNANFRNVNFRIVHVGYANFEGADFTGSDRRHTEFSQEQNQGLTTSGVFEMANAPTQISGMPGAPTEGADSLFDEGEVTDIAPEAAAPQPAIVPVQAAPPAAAAAPAGGPPPSMFTDQPDKPLISARPVKGKGPDWLKIGIGIVAGVLVIIIAVFITAAIKGGGETGPVTPPVPGTTPVAGTPGTTPGTDPTPPVVEVDPAERIAQLEKKLAEAEKAQGDLAKTQVITNEAVEKAAGDLTASQEEFAKRIESLQAKLDESKALHDRLKLDFDAARGSIEKAKNAMVAREKGLLEKLNGLHARIKDTEAKMKEKEGGLQHLTTTIAQLQETNDGLVGDYEKKIASYKAQIAKLSQWYDTDKKFSEKNFDHFLVGWGRYTVVGAPGASYVVGVKFTKDGDGAAQSEIFVLGIQPLSKPVFEVLVFDKKGNQLETEMKTMLERGVEQGRIVTAKSSFSFTGETPRYFAVDFVQ